MYKIVRNFFFFFAEDEKGLIGLVIQCISVLRESFFVRIVAFAQCFIIFELYFQVITILLIN